MNRDIMTDMGLREKKAVRTRAQIVDAALDLFLDRGFDQTTMEEIAERAEIGSSTLYRYFPSKDLVILEPLLGFTELGQHLRDRPADEPLNHALGESILASLGGLGADDHGGSEHMAEVRRIVDSNPGPRAKLWDVVAGYLKDLEQAVADRLDRPVDDPSVTLTARLALDVYELAAEKWWAGGHSLPVADVVAGVLVQVQSAVVVMPAPPLRD